MFSVILYNFLERKFLYDVQQDADRLSPFFFKFHVLRPLGLIYQEKKNVKEMRTGFEGYLNVINDEVDIIKKSITKFSNYLVQVCLVGYELIFA